MSAPIITVGQTLYSPDMWRRGTVRETIVRRVNRVTWRGDDAYEQRIDWVDRPGAPHGWRTTREAVINDAIRELEASLTALDERAKNTRETLEIWRAVKSAGGDS